MGQRLLFLTVLALTAVAASGQNITVDDLDCVPLEPQDTGADHGLIWAQMSPDQAGTEVRLYFRRLHTEVEDFYYMVMQPAGNGDYWGVLPDPEDQAVDVKPLSWWQAKEASDDRNPDGDLDVDTIRERAQVGRAESRAWIETFSDGEWDAWIADQKSEPTEYFTAVYDSSGNRLAASDMKITSVRKDCETSLEPKQLGEASNQTIGETAAWQHDEALFHWECAHVVTRIDYAGVKQADAVCRACVVAVIPFWIPATVSGAALAGVVGVEPTSVPPDPPVVTTTASPSSPSDGQ